MRKLRPMTFVLTGIVAVVVIQLYLSRDHFLDDAFIHLRIAHTLWNTGNLAYNGTTCVFASSSPLYTVLLTAGSALTFHQYLPKIVNLVSYAVVLFLLIRAVRKEQQLRKVLLFVVLLIVASPFGIRWLTDGMETGLVFLFSFCLGFVATTLGKVDQCTTGWLVFASLLVMLSVWLRIEYVLISAVMASTVFVSTIRTVSSETAMQRLRTSVTRSGPILFAGLVALGVIYWLFSAILPDTAIAKQTHIGSPDIIQTIKDILVTHVASSFFGVGVLSVWALSTVLAFRRNHGTERPVVLLANSSVLLFLIPLILTHQAIQGVRYFLFLEIFLISFNLYSLPGSTPSWNVHKSARVAICAGLVLWCSVDLFLFHRVVESRSATYNRFSDSNFERLHGKNGIAYDIGMIGYFSQANIYDVGGLVNGRSVAKLTAEQRLQFFSGRKTDFIFANAGQLREIKRHVDITGWTIRDAFDFMNMNGNRDTHFLIERTQPSDSVR